MAPRMGPMRVFSNLDLDGKAPVRAHANRGSRGPQGVISTRMKKIQRIVIPIAVVAIGVALFFLGRMFYLILTGQ